MGDKKKSTLPKGFWSVESNRNNYLTWLSQKLGIKNPLDWYSVDSTHFKENNGGGLLDRYQGSVVALLKESFPNEKWIAWKFNRMPRKFWSSKENQQMYIEWLKAELKIESPSDWKKLTRQSLIEYNGKGLLSYFDNSMHNLVESLLSTSVSASIETWEVNHRIDKEYWESHENRLKYMNWLQDKLNIKSMEDWYDFKTEDVIKYRGHFMVEKYGSLYDILKAHYPSHTWYPWMFKKLSNGYWNNRENRIQYLEYLKEKLNIKSPEDWYNIEENQICRPNILRNFKRTLFLLLKDSYPDYAWKEWKFKKQSKNFWKSPDNLKDKLEHVAKVLEVNNLDDWYRVSRKQLIMLDAFGCITEYGSLYNALKIIHPNHMWDKGRFHQVKKSSQRWLLIKVKEILSRKNHTEINTESHSKPKENELIILEDHVIHLSGSENKFIELDIWIPSLNLAFEYQGVYIHSRMTRHLN
eukprot:TRINITY_DN3871_c0_g1_i1.p1 TRINITY_DN3871_c0_g1~~TRINITY_DN3871_c0_g1_i1.p1  ORF type:complete len:468 (+),score=35.99 TRINITY_DN3871_c0_g1_i1:69-1472(+)